MKLFSPICCLCDCETDKFRIAQLCVLFARVSSYQYGKRGNFLGGKPPWSSFHFFNSIIFHFSCLCAFCAFPVNMILPHAVELLQPTTRCLGHPPLCFSVILWMLSSREYSRQTCRHLWHELAEIITPFQRCSALTSIRGLSPKPDRFAIPLCHAVYTGYHYQQFMHQAYQTGVKEWRNDGEYTGLVNVLKW